MVTKAQMIEAIQALPDDAQYQDVLCELDRLDVVNAIEVGLAQAEAGNVIPHEEVRRRFAKWLK